jgi:hypothetical protein
MPLEDPESFIGAVKFFESLDLDPIGLFLDGHSLKENYAEKRRFYQPAFRFSLRRAAWAAARRAMGTRKGEQDT